MAVPRRLVLADTGAQRLDRAAYLPDHAGEPLAQHPELQRPLGRRRLGRAGRRRGSPSDAISWATPSCISRASRRRSSAVAASRNAAKSKAVSRCTVVGLEALRRGRPACGGGPGRPGRARGRGRRTRRPPCRRRCSAASAKRGRRRAGRCRCRGALRQLLDIASSWALPPWSLMIGVSCSPRGTCTTRPRTGSSSCTALAIWPPGRPARGPAEAVGQADQLADQRLGVAVGVERVRRLAVGRVDEAADQAEPEAEYGPGQAR